MNPEELILGPSPSEKLNEPEMKVPFAELPHFNILTTQAAYFPVNPWESQ